MKVVKLIGKKYEEAELEENSKIVRKWLIIKQLRKEELVGKHHNIENCDKVTKEFEEMMEKVDQETKEFYRKYVDENWKETHPIMKNVSAFAKIRPKDGTEFCILI